LWGTFHIQTITVVEALSGLWPLLLGGREWCNQNRAPVPYTAPFPFV
jgi:hypothetical protein